LFDGGDDEMVVPDRAALHRVGPVAVWVCRWPVVHDRGKPFGEDKLNSWLLWRPATARSVQKRGEHCPIDMTTTWRSGT
jgi:hypothetical protein